MTFLNHEVEKPRQEEFRSSMELLASLEEAQGTDYQPDSGEGPHEHQSACEDNVPKRGVCDHEWPYPT